jgi:hypothetical protein
MKIERGVRVLADWCGKRPGSIDEVLRSGSKYKVLVTFDQKTEGAGYSSAWMLIDELGNGADGVRIEAMSEMSPTMAVNRSMKAMRAVLAGVDHGEELLALAQVALEAEFE